MRDIEELSDDESHIEDRGTKVKDFENRSLTTEERDKIIREYNAEHSIHRIIPDAVDTLDQSDRIVTDSENLNDTDEDTDSSSEKKKIDSEEVCRLYIEDGLSLKEVGKIFGFKTGAPIKRILEAEGLELRSAGAQKTDINSEEVCRLYLEEELSLDKIGEHFGLKSRSPVKRILETAGVEIRPVGFQKIDIDHDEVYRLYFEERKDLKEIADHFDCKSTDPIHRIFDEQGWKTRYQETYEKDFEPEEVFRLYNEDGLSLRKIGEHFGVSIGPIRRIFEEHNMEYGQEIQIDPEVIHKLYFDEGLSKEEVCERLGVSKRPINRIIEEQDLLRNRSGLIDIDDFSRLYYVEELTMTEISKHFEVSQNTLKRFLKKHKLEERTTRTVREIRDEMFGKDCVSCRRPKEVIHKKDGEPHERYRTWTKKALRTVNPNEWVALCEPCHRLTHSLMKSFSCEWDDIEKILTELAKEWLS